MVLPTALYIHLPQNLINLQLIYEAINISCIFIVIDGWLVMYVHLILSSNSLIFTISLNIASWQYLIMFTRALPTETSASAHASYPIETNL